MTLKIEFVERATREGANKSALCREFGISRQTGHKWLKRFARDGYEGLQEESRRPKSAPLASAEEVVVEVVRARDRYPKWGPKKLRTVLTRTLRERAPSVSTIERVLRRFGKVRQRRARRPVSEVLRAPNRVTHAPNDLWTIDFKGDWRCGDNERCIPLTVRDAFTRFVFAAQLMLSTGVEAVRAVMERIFLKYGLPKAIQCDNGSPFVSTSARAGLSRLSAWWVSLGIEVVRSRPGCPEDNGAHERMHRDVAEEVEALTLPDLASTQRALDKWRQEFNHVRPHEALQNRTPAELYRPSERRSLLPVKHSYPAPMLVRLASGPDGLVSVGGVRARLGAPLRGHEVGLEQLEHGRFRVWFYHLNLGDIDVELPARDIDRFSIEILERRGANAEQKLGA